MAWEAATPQDPRLHGGTRTLQAASTSVSASTARSAHLQRVGAALARPQHRGRQLHSRWKRHETFGGSLALLTIRPAPAQSHAAPPTIPPAFVDVPTALPGAQPPSPAAAPRRPGRA